MNANWLNISFISRLSVPRMLNKSDKSRNIQQNAFVNHQGHTARGNSLPFNIRLDARFYKLEPSNFNSSWEFVKDKSLNVFRLETKKLFSSKLAPFKRISFIRSVGANVCIQTLRLLRTNDQSRHYFKIQNSRRDFSIFERKRSKNYRPYSNIPVCFGLVLVLRKNKEIIPSANQRHNLIWPVMHTSEPAQVRLLQVQDEILPKPRIELWNLTLYMLSDPKLVILIYPCPLDIYYLGTPFISAYWNAYKPARLKSESTGQSADIPKLHPLVGWLKIRRESVG